jgi:hypothetical protein
MVQKPRDPSVYSIKLAITGFFPPIAFVVIPEEIVTIVLPCRCPRRPNGTLRSRHYKGIVEQTVHQILWKIKKVDRVCLVAVETHQVAEITPLQVKLLMHVTLRRESVWNALVEGK